MGGGPRRGRGYDAGVWRADDEALLGRIEDELLMEQLWRAEAGAGTVALHPRASGLVRMLRTLPGGEAAVAAAVDGLRAGACDVSQLRALTRPSSLRGLEGRLLHHLAVFHRRVADAIGPRSAEAAVVLLGRSMAAWFALGAERSYLRRLSRAVLGDSASDDVCESAAEEAVLAPMTELGKRAQQGAPSLSRASLTALRALAQVPQAGRLASCKVATQKRLERYADKQRSLAIERALTPISNAISEATANGSIEQAAPRLMARVAAVWRWADRDEHVERYAVDQVTPVAWNIYADDTDYHRVRALIAPLSPLVDHLAYRIQDDPSRIAYAAPCAQMFVFRSEAATTSAEQRRLAERAVALCPSHRNGRLILATLLCNEVRDRVDRGLLLPVDRKRLLALVDRAEALYPRTSGLDELRVRLESSHWWGG